MNIPVGQIKPITDESSFNTFYSQYHSFVFGVAYQFTGCSGTAADIKQQVFLNIWVNRHKIDPLRDVLSYVFICTRNEALNTIANRKKVAESIKRYFADPCRLYTNPIFEIEVRMIYERVHKNAVKKLPVECRKVYQLLIEQDNHYLKVAEALDLTPSTVKNQKGYARKRLRKFIGDEALLQ